MSNENMIASCPRCGARYRMERARLRPEGVRLRCNRCEAVFRVTPPVASASEAVASPPSGEAPSAAAPVAQRPAAAAAPAAPSPAGVAPTAQPRAEAERSRLVLVADADVEAGKAIASTLVAWGLEPLLVHDGVEAILSIQRALPRAVVLDAALPKMFGFQVCELVKRNESLRSIRVVLVGAIHHRDRYRREPSEFYGADAYVERPQLPEALRPTLAGFGFELDGGRAASPAPGATPPAAAPRPAPSEPLEPPTAELPVFDLSEPDAAPQPEPRRPEPDPFSEPEPLLDLAAPGPEAALEAATLPQPKAPLEAPAPPPPKAPVEAPAPPPPKAPAAAPGPAPASQDPAVAAAERLARIIVSDVVLYNPERFEAGVRDGNVAEALEAELEEGRSLFEQRVPAELRAGRDFLVDELLRVARSRGMAG